MSISRTQAEWNLIFKKWDKSKLSQLKFCEKEGISTSTFCSRLNTKNRNTSKKSSAPIFIPAVKKTDEKFLTIQIGNMVVKIPSSTNPKIIGQILNEIGG